MHDKECEVHEMLIVHSKFLSFECLKLAEGVGSAPTSVRTDPVFETGAASLYLPAFRESDECQMSSNK